MNSGSDYEDGFDILLIEQRAVVLVRLRLVADGRDAMIDGLLLDVADGHAAPARNVLGASQVRSAAAAADNAILHRFDGRHRLLNGGESGNRGGGGAGTLQQVSSREFVVL